MSDIETSRWTEEIIGFAKEFMSIKVTQGKYRLTRGPADFMHTMGYYCAQVKRHPADDPATRLHQLAEAIEHIASNLET